MTLRNGALAGIELVCKPLMFFFNFVCWVNLLTAVLTLLMFSSDAQSGAMTCRQNGLT